VAPADDIDPAYGAGLREAVRAGVEALAYRAELRPRSASAGPRLPVVL
jgi:sugar fermentation stimulation protein A